MDKVSLNGKIFTYFEYAKEHDFEKDVIEHSNEIFGPKSIYIDIKKKIQNDNIITIPGKDMGSGFTSTHFSSKFSIISRSLK